MAKSPGAIYKHTNTCENNMVHNKIYHDLCKMGCSSYNHKACSCKTGRSYFKIGRVPKEADTMAL